MAMPLNDSELRSRDTTNALREIKNWPLISSSSHPAPTTLGRSLGRRPNFSVLVIHRVVLAKLTTRKSARRPSGAAGDEVDAQVCASLATIAITSSARASSGGDDRQRQAAEVAG